MSLRQVGSYRLDFLLGSGGMGEVYKAYDTHRERYVALKLLPEAFSGDQEYIARFRRESNVAARLRDPHVVPIHDFGEIDGQLFIDMRLVDGSDISAQLDASGPIAAPRAVHLVSQAAEALDAAHADQLVHRDVKPSNILVTANDFVYVVDFGIARLTGGPQTSLTITGATIGTLHYMAPERFSGHGVDGRADVYSLACVLHESLTGVPPFTANELPALMYAQLYTDPPAASSLAAGVPAALDAVIARGMAKDPGERFATAGALAAAAREALLDREPAAAAAKPARAVTVSAPAVAGPAVAEPTADRPAVGAPGVPTQTVLAAAVDDREPAEPPAVVPPENDVPPGNPSGEEPARPSRRPRRYLLGAVVVAAVAAIILPFVLMNGGSGRAGASGSTSPAANSATQTGAAPSPSAPRLALPTAGPAITIGQTPNFVQVAPDGTAAYVTNPGSKTISVIDTATDKVTRTIKITQGSPQSVAFSPDGKTAYVSIYGRGTELVAFVDTATGKETGVVQANNISPGPAATGPGGRYLYVPNHNMSMTGARQNLLDVIDTVKKKLVATIPVAANPHWAVLGKNGDMYITDHMSTVVTVLDPRKNNTKVTEIEVGETPHSEALSPDGRRLAVTSYNGNQVFMIDTATNKQIGTIPTGRLPLDIAYSPDGRYLFTVNNEDNTVTVIETADDSVLGTIATGKQPTSIAVARNGRQAFVTDENSGSVEIINIPQ